MPEPDNSLGRKILSFFIKDESAPNAPSSGTPATPVPAQPTAMPANPVHQSASAPQPTGSIDTKFVAHFASVLEKANVQGPDYFEFREMLRNLAELGLSEEKRFQAAWASFKAMASSTPGTKAEITLLTNTANQYLTALGQDRDAFLKSVDVALTERVGGLQNEQKQLQADNEALTKQIAELQKRIASNSERLSKINDEISEQSLKLTQNRSNFETTYASFTEQIKADVNHIQSYLK